MRWLRRSKLARAVLLREDKDMHIADIHRLSCLVRLIPHRLKRHSGSTLAESCVNKLEATDVNDDGAGATVEVMNAKASVSAYRSFPLNN